MAQTTVLDLTSSEKQLSLRTSGFESCTVHPPAWNHERALRRFYSRPVRADVHTFVNELLAMSLAPRPRASEVAKLPGHERARLRCAVVSVCKREGDWKALHGSHLSPDERLFALMLWRWEESENVRVILRQEHEKFDAQRSMLTPALSFPVAAGLGASNSLQAVAEFASMPALSPGLAELFDVSVPAALGLPDSLQAAVGEFASMRAAAAEHQKMVDKLSVFSDDSLRLGLRLGMPFKPSLLTMVEDVSASVAGWQSVFDTTKRYHEMTEALVHYSVPSVRATGLAHLAGLDLGTSKAIESLVRTIADPGLMGAIETLSSWKGDGHIAQIAAGLGTGSLLPQFLGVGEDLRRQMEPMQEFMAVVRVVERFDRRWQQRALYYILGRFNDLCDVWEMHALTSLNEVEVEEAILFALEDVVSDGTFTSLMRAAVAKAPHLNDSQRIHLDHALEHAAEGKYVHASPPLYQGLEGAFWQVAYVKTIVTLERRDPARLSKKIEFDSMVKRLGIPPEFKTFVNRALFGTVGDRYRHGGAGSGERRQVLLGVAALAGWCQEFAGEPAFDLLIESAAEVLPGAVERARLPALTAG